MTDKIPMICKECDNDAFDEEDGFFYCQQCGLRADDMVATGVDEGDLFGEGGDVLGATYNPINTRHKPPSNLTTPSQVLHTEETFRYYKFRSQLDSSSPGSINKPENLGTETITPANFGPRTLSYKDYYGQVRDRYVSGFLMMVTFQCDAVVEAFNVTPLIIGLVAPICLRFVALSGVFDDGWADKAIHDSQLQAEEVREVKRRHGDKAEPRNFDGKRAVTIWLSQLRKSLPLSSSLAISFLACHKAGAPVLPTDVVRWAREGKVPYLSCFLKIQEKMGKRSIACPVEASVMFKPDDIFSAQSLEARAASIAATIGLPLPPVNFYGIASNYLKQLSIPEDKVLDLVRLIQNWSMPSELYLSKNELRLPTRVCVMSIVIVAIRMLYNINGFGVWEQSLGADSTSSIEAEVVSEEEHDDSSVHDDEEEVSETESATEELPDITKASETEELLKNLEAKYDAANETVDYDENDLCSYLSHGKNELFAGLVEASADDTYSVDNLWNGYTKDEGSKQFDTPLKRGRYWDDDVSRYQLDDTKLSDGNGPCTSPSRGSESRPMDHDQSFSEQRDSSPENHNKEKRSRERAITRLITEMGILQKIKMTIWLS